jgi:ketosteroid isomerase-like protein
MLKGGNMKRLVALLTLSVAVVVAGVVVARPAPAPSDEETLKNLELEWHKVVFLSDAHIAFAKANFASRTILVTPPGQIDDQTIAEVEKDAVEFKAANPNAKVTSDIHDIAVHLYGDTAIVTYSSTMRFSGFKMPAMDATIQTVRLDTWQKQSGKWKFLAGASVPAEPEAK